MPRATLRIKSNDALVTLSKTYSETEFKVLGAWSVAESLRVLIEASPINLSALRETLTEIPTITDVEMRHTWEQTVLFEVSTPSPPPHGAMGESGIVPSFPLSLEDGWFVGDLVATRERIAEFRDELEAGEIEYHLIQFSEMDDSSNVLTERQVEVIELAVEHGYYESPRRCSLTDLAEILEVNKSVISRILHRAEGRIVSAYCSSR